MKTKFIGPIRDNLHSNKVLLFGRRDRMGDTDTSDPRGMKEFRGIQPMADGIDHVGNEFRIPIRTARNASPGSRGERSRLPAAGHTGFVQLTDPLRYNYASFDITGQLLKASESNEGAFRRALTVEMEDSIDALKRKMNIDAYGTGTGTRATVTGAVTSTTLPVDSTVWLAAGDLIDVYDLSGSTYLANAREVLSVDRVNKTVTVSGANIAVAVGDYLINASADSTSVTPNNDKDMCINGLQKIVNSTGVLHTLDPATLDLWKSTVVQANGAMVGEAILRDLVNGIGFESGADEDLVFITTRGIQKRYVASLQANKRFTNEQSTTLRGGFKAILFDDQPMVIDDHCPRGHVWGLNTDAMFWSESSDWEWMEKDGAVLHRVQGFDLYSAYIFKYCNLGTWARNRHGKIVGAQDDDL